MSRLGKTLSASPPTRPPRSWQSFGSGNLKRRCTSNLLVPGLQKFAAHDNESTGATSIQLLVRFRDALLTCGMFSKIGDRMKELLAAASRTYSSLCAGPGQLRVSATGQLLISHNGQG